MVFKGIDLSKHNGVVDFAKVKAAGVQFVILRAGFGKSASQKDVRFEEYYTKAKAAGLDVGAYWFSYALNPETAKQEAQACISCIQGKRFEYPIYFDLEDDPNSGSYPLKTGKSNCSAMVRAFCGELESAGYWAGLYISRSPLQTNITEDVAKRYALWIAEYNSRCNYGGIYGMWQYSATGRIDGIYGNVDMDECYMDYPTAVKKAKLNGYNKEIRYKAVIDGLTKAQADAIKAQYPTAAITEV